MYLPTFVSFYLSLYYTFIYLSIFSICQFIHLSFYLFICSFIDFCMYVQIYICMYLSNCHFTSLSVFDIVLSMYHVIINLSTYLLYRQRAEWPSAHADCQ